VRGVWPLPTWLNSLPTEVSETGSVCVAALATKHACLYRHASDGTRTVECWHGPNAPATFAKFLHDLFAKDANEPVLLFASAVAVVEAVNAVVPLGDRSGLEVLTLDEALSREAVIPSRHPARLLPSAPLITAERAVAAASLALLLTAAGIAAHYAQDYATASSNAADRAALTAKLRIEVGHARANADEIARLRSQVDVPAGMKPTDTLKPLTEQLPKEIVLDEVEVTPRTFAVRGWVAPGANSFEAWFARGHSTLPQWRLMHETGGPAGPFHVRGVLP
jgi:hypothetical protein